jgi:hypothetical protein
MIRKINQNLSLFNFTCKYSFSFKYVPLNKLKFEDINFYEPVSKLYELDKPINKQSEDRKIIIASTLLYTNLVFDPFLLTWINLAINIFAQPFLYYKYISLRKESSHAIKLMYILRNGQQILIKTVDNSTYLIHIQDFEDIKASGEDTLIFKTNEKMFTLNNKHKYINEEIVNAIKEGRLIKTNKSFSNYDRLTVDK